MGKLIVLLGESNDLLLEAMTAEEFSTYHKVMWPELSLAKERLPLTQTSIVWEVNNIVYNHSTPIGPVRNSTGTVICTQSELVFTAIRVAIHEEKLNHEEVEFRYYEFDDGSYELIKPDIDGRLAHWPTNMFREQDHLLCKLLAPKRAKVLSSLNNETVAKCVAAHPNNKIEAIKLLRYETGCFLKEAKDHVEAFLQVKED